MKVQKLKRAVIKEELLAITGNHIEALILNQMLYWRERVNDFDDLIDEEKKNMTNSESIENAEKLKKHGWIYKTATDLANEIMISLSPSNIRKHILSLIKKKYLDERSNPDHRWDRTKQYRVSINIVIKSLSEMGYSLEGYKLPTNAFSMTENAFSKTKIQSHETENQITKSEIQTSHFEKAIPEITTEITIEKAFKDSSESCATKRIKTPKASDGRVKEFQNFFLGNHPNGKKYVVSNWGKFGTQIKSLLKAMDDSLPDPNKSLDELKRRCKIFFSSNKEWYRESGYSFNVFMTDINALNTLTNKSKGKNGKTQHNFNPAGLNTPKHRTWQFTDSGELELAT